MNTTSLFVELIVIGSGVLLWIIFFVASFFGFAWIPLDKLGNPVLLIPILSVTYLLGIVMDRISDYLFQPLDKPLTNKYFSNKLEYHNAKYKVYENSELIRQNLEYGQSRLRICRAWFVIWILLLMLFPLYISYEYVSLRVLTLSFFCIVIFAILTFFAWKKIRISYLDKIKERNNKVK